MVQEGNNVYQKFGWDFVLAVQPLNFIIIFSVFVVIFKFTYGVGS